MTANLLACTSSASRDRESDAVKILDTINARAHQTGDFRLKNLLMVAYLVLLAIASKVRPAWVVYQTQSPEFVANTEYIDVKVDDFYYDLIEVLGHHIPVPLVPQSIFDRLCLHVRSDYFS